MYSINQTLVNKTTKEKVEIKTITKEMSPVGEILCFELEPIGFQLPKNANYFITQITLEESFDIETKGGFENDIG